MVYKWAEEVFVKFDHRRSFTFSCHSIPPIFDTAVGQLRFLTNNSRVGNVTEKELQSLFFFPVLYGSFLYSSLSIALSGFKASTCVCCKIKVS